MVTNVLREDYLGLDSLIHVNVNDSGVDDKHRLWQAGEGAECGSDPEGHDVCGRRDRRGRLGQTPLPPTRRRVLPGSDFKGMAPRRLHVLKADDDKVNNPVSDDWLQPRRPRITTIARPASTY